MDKYTLAEKAANIGKGIKDIVTIADAVINSDSLSVVSEESNIPDTPIGKVGLMMEALDSDFNSMPELVAKKAMAAAMLIAKSGGVLPEELKTGIAASGVASIADEAVSRMKVAYQTAVGNIDAFKGADILIDRATARALAVSDKVVEEGIDMALNTVGPVVAAVFPPVAPVVVALKVAQPMLTKGAQVLVKKGINALNTVAKKTVRTIGNFVKERVKSLASFKLKSLLLS